jgi:hypothetical protein
LERGDAPLPSGIHLSDAGTGVCGMTLPPDAEPPGAGRFTMAMLAKTALMSRNAVRPARHSLPKVRVWALIGLKPAFT